MITTEQILKSFLKKAIFWTLLVLPEHNDWKNSEIKNSLRKIKIYKKVWTNLEIRPMQTNMEYEHR